WTIPAFGGRAITLVDLATHTSGLPRMPTNFTSPDPEDPYATYDEGKMKAFLASYSLPRAPGTMYEYSNLGMSILGIALSARGGKPWETLIRERILDPLGMRDTRVEMTSDQSARFATGHGPAHEPNKPWHLASMAPAGAL